MMLDGLPVEGFEDDPGIWVSGSAPELRVACPKCFALAGQPCTSITHGGPLATRVYRSHKKRRTASYVVPRVLTASGVPVRPASRGCLRVGAVDSAARGLDGQSTRPTAG